ncbi:enolase-phosphatase E1-like [Tubulanus polymorphus]|uniref:enolase-phosphatase E1-like n=1 Tax=Tubulanus polymorphus TaxID=672921 RepID=UPI003DA4673E
MAEAVVSQKRSISECIDHLEGVKVVLLDIEGTTTPITFVKEKLFPYVKENVEEYLNTHYDEDECHEDIKVLREQALKDEKEEVEGVVTIPNKDSEKDEIIKKAVENILWQMSLDRKTTGLKQLQGHIWRHAYKSGNIKSPVYEDVSDAMKKLTKTDRKVYIYSSGSVEAQKLIYRYSDQGDLTEYLSGHFDTKIGAKGDKESYTKIVEEIDCKPEEALFLTDIPKECKAALEAGLKACVVIRPGNAELTEDEKKTYNQISSFAELFPEK